LGIGDWGLQSPIPNPQSPVIYYYKYKNVFEVKSKIINLYLL